MKTILFLFVFIPFILFGQETPSYSTVSENQSLFNTATLYRSFFEEKAALVTGITHRQQWIDSGMSPRTQHVFMDMIFDSDESDWTLKPTVGLNMLMDQFGPTTLNSAAFKIGLVLGAPRNERRRGYTSRPYGFYLTLAPGLRYNEIDGNQLFFLDQSEVAGNVLNRADVFYLNAGLSYFLKFNISNFDNILYTGVSFNNLQSRDQRLFEIDAIGNDLFILQIPVQTNIWLGWSLGFDNKKYHDLYLLLKWAEGTPTDLLISYRHTIDFFWVGLGTSIHLYSLTNTWSAPGAQSTANINFGIDWHLSENYYNDRFSKIRFTTAIAYPVSTLGQYFGASYEAGITFTCNWNRR